jgi:hypothetical protein
MAHVTYTCAIHLWSITQASTWYKELTKQSASHKWILDSYRFLDDKVTPIVGSMARIRTAVTNIRMLFLAGRAVCCHGTYLIVSQGFL